MEVSHLERRGRSSIHPYPILMELDAAAGNFIDPVGAKACKVCPP